MKAGSRFQYFFRFLIINEDIELIPIAIPSPHMAELISRLLTSITLTAVFPNAIYKWTWSGMFLFQGFLEVEIRY